MNVLITAGPSREYLDPVRFLTNASSGRMGICIADEMVRADHEVTLILGPTDLHPESSQMNVRRVTTADEMETEVHNRFPECDMLIMTAAVSDIRSKETAEEKLKKDEIADWLEIETTPDILEEAGRQKKNQVLIGFAVESDHFEERGRKKLNTKNLDLLVMNEPDAMGARENQVSLLEPNGSLEKWPRMKKPELARKLVKRFLELGSR